MIQGEDKLCSIWSAWFIIDSLLNMNEDSHTIRINMKPNVNNIRLDKDELERFAMPITVFRIISFINQCIPNNIPIHDMLKIIKLFDNGFVGEDNKYNEDILYKGRYLDYKKDIDVIQQNKDDEKSD
jgi:hypothetical protein